MRWHARKIDYLPSRTHPFILLCPWFPTRLTQIQTDMNAFRFLHVFLLIFVSYIKIL